MTLLASGDPLNITLHGGNRMDTTTEAAKLPTLNLCELERLAIVGALALRGGNKTHAARELGLSVRTLQRKLKDYAVQERQNNALRIQESGL